MSGVTIFSKDEPKWHQPAPLGVQAENARGEVVKAQSGYKRLSKHHDGAVAEGIVETPGGAKIHFEDYWTFQKNSLLLNRRVKVLKDGEEKGFLSAFELDTVQPSTTEDFELFAPGFLYGDTYRDHFRNAYNGYYLKPPDIGHIKDLIIREDRLPAPVLALRSSDNNALSIVHCDPKGDTKTSDTYDNMGPHIDEIFRFASLGIRELDNHVRVCLWFPGTEGTVTCIKRLTPSYTNTPYTNMWRRIYHPLKRGLIQRYIVEVGMDYTSSATSMIRSSWRRAFDILKPRILYHNLDSIERIIIRHISDHVQVLSNGAAGIPSRIHPVTGEVEQTGFGLGFAARNDCAAYHLLRSGYKEENERYIKQGRAILDFWTTRTGPGLTPSKYYPDQDKFGGGFDNLGDSLEYFGTEAVSLREMSEGHQSCLRSYNLEKRFGVEHPQWLKWCKGFGDWLLTQQQPSGGFPRWWSIETGEVVDSELNSSYNPVSFLCELATTMQEERFLSSAMRAGEYLYENQKQRGTFKGGTIEFRYNLIDKEAASISLEAYLALYQATEDKRWLEAAQLAADISETYLYVWEVPMCPSDIDVSAIHWKPGATTIGLQIIHAANFCRIDRLTQVDYYLSWNVDEFVQLYELTGDEHYWNIAMILLHNTKSMLALPSRIFDLKEPGFQQEHWSIATNRGMARPYRAWYPWVTLSHLTGIAKLEDRNPELWKKALFFIIDRQS